MSRLLELFLPGPEVAVLAGAVGFLGGGAALAAIGARARGARVPDTRMIFHFLVFTGALVVQLAWGSPGTAAYGSAVASLVLGAVALGDGNSLYEALARPSDRPRRDPFVVVPLVSTTAGGVLANLLAGELALAGYLVAGWGDAVAEPVGVRCDGVGIRTGFPPWAVCRPGEAWRGRRPSSWPGEDESPTPGEGETVWIETAVRGAGRLFSAEALPSIAPRD